MFVVGAFGVVTGVAEFVNVVAEISVVGTVDD